MPELKEYRLSDKSMNSYICQLVLPEFGEKLNSFYDMSNSVVYCNIKDFIDSQELCNIHSYFHKIPQRKFQLAKLYLSGVCEDTVFQNDVHSRAAFMEVAKLFLLEMTALQLILQGRYPGIIIQPTIPTILAEKIQSLEYAMPAGMEQDLVMVESFAKVSEFLKDNANEVGNALQMLMSLGPYVMQNLDSRRLLTHKFGEGDIGTDVAISRAYMLFKGSLVFGGNNDY